MGKSESKPVVVAQNQDREKRLRLLVLYKKGQEPEEGKDNLCDALNTYPPPGSLNVYEDKVAEIPDSGQLPQQIKTWVSEWVKQGLIVPVCLLSDVDVQANFGQSEKIIAFCFKNPPVSVSCPISINVDFFTATPRDMIAEMDELVAAIRAECHIRCIPLVN